MGEDEEEQESIEENLQVHAFFDRSVLEVFVNRRTAISTRVYYPSDQLCGIRCFAQSSSQSDRRPTELVQADVWDGLGGVE